MSMYTAPALWAPCSMNTPSRNSVVRSSVVQPIINWLQNRTGIGWRSEVSSMLPTISSALAALSAASIVFNPAVSTVSEPWIRCPIFTEPWATSLLSPKNRVFQLIAPPMSWPSSASQRFVRSKAWQHNYHSRFHYPTNKQKVRYVKFYANIRNFPQAARHRSISHAFPGTRFHFREYVYDAGNPPSSQPRFSYQPPTAGLTVSLLVLAVAFGSLVYGPLSDRVGRKKVMVGSSFLVVIPTLLCGFAPGFTTLVILRTLQGFLMPGLTSVAIPYVNEEFEGKGRGLAMGIYVCGLTLGGLFARVGSAALTGFFNWRIALDAFALPTLIAALVMWKFLPETASKQHGEINAPPQRGAFFRQTLRDMLLHLRNRRLVGAFIIGFTLFFGFIGTFTNYPFWMPASIHGAGGKKG